MKLKYNKIEKKMKIDKLNDIRRRYKQLKSAERFNAFFKIKKNKSSLEYTKLLRKNIGVLE